MGFTSTAFAYGQTGSGKTYSLLGPEENVCLLADDSCTENLPPACLECIDEVRKAKVGEQGLLPRAAQFLFTLLDDDAEVRVSFLELYNEKVYDLLAESGAALGEFISVVARRQRLAGLTIPPSQRCGSGRSLRSASTCPTSRRSSAARSPKFSSCSGAGWGRAARARTR